MKRAKRICAQPGCTNTIDQQKRYCDYHKKLYEDVNVNRLRELKTNPENVNFYKKAKWRRTSEAYRKQQPLCERCYDQDIINKAVLVHHDPELSILLSEGKDPCDFKYLEALCFNCHQKELRAKRNITIKR